MAGGTIKKGTLFISAPLLIEFYHFSAYKDSYTRELYAVRLIHPQTGLLNKLMKAIYIKDR